MKDEKKKSGDDRFLSRLNILFREASEPAAEQSRAPFKQEEGSRAPLTPLTATQQVNRGLFVQNNNFSNPPPPLLPPFLLNFILRRGDHTVHKHEGTGKERGAGKKKSERVGGGDDDGGGEGLREGGGDGRKKKECSFKGNVQPGVKLQPIVLHIVPEANSKNSNKKEKSSPNLTGRQSVTRVRLPQRDGRQPRRAPQEKGPNMAGVQRNNALFRNSMAFFFEDLAIYISPFIGLIFFCWNFENCIL